MEVIPKVFGVISVGVFPIVFAIFLFSLLIPASVWPNFYKALGVFLQANKDTNTIIIGILILPLMFGMGLLAQDYADYLTDSDAISQSDGVAKCEDYNPVVFLSSAHKSIKNCLGEEGWLRFLSLAYSEEGFLENKKFNLKKDCMIFKLNSLGRAIKDSSNVFSSSQQSEAKNYSVLKVSRSELEQCALIREDEYKILSSGGKYLVDKRLICLYQNNGNNGCHKEIKTYQADDIIYKVSKYYYSAKNWAYRKAAPHRDELENIQMRIEFSRSLYTLAYIALNFMMLGAIIFIVIDVAYWVLKKKSSTRLNLTSSAENSFTVKIVSLDAPKKSFKREVYVSKLRDRAAIDNTVKNKEQICFFVKYICFLFVGFLLYLLMSVCKSGYQNSENIFNERAMGYFQSYCEQEGGSRVCGNQIKK